MPVQHDRAWVRQARPEEITAAIASGKLDDVLQGREPEERIEPEPVEQVTRQQLAGAPAEQVVAWHESGALKELLDGQG